MSADLTYVIAGLALLLAVVLPDLLSRWPLSPPIVLVGVGLVLGLTPLPDGLPLDPQTNRETIEHVTELTVIVALNEPANERELSTALAGGAGDAQVEVLLVRAPIFWYRIRLAVAMSLDGVAAADPQTLQTMLAQVERLGRLVTQLLDLSRLHGADEVYDRSVDVQILRLRRKIEVDPARPQFIKTERGAGYVFDVPVEVLY